MRFYVKIMACFFAGVMFFPVAAISADDDSLDAYAKMIDALAEGGHSQEDLDSVKRLLAEQKALTLPKGPYKESYKEAVKSKLDRLTKAAQKDDRSPLEKIQEIGQRFGEEIEGGSKTGSGNYEEIQKLKEEIGAVSKDPQDDPQEIDEKEKLREKISRMREQGDEDAEKPESNVSEDRRMRPERRTRQKSNPAAERQRAIENYQRIQRQREQRYNRRYGR